MSTVEQDFIKRHDAFNAVVYGPAKAARDEACAAAERRCECEREALVKAREQAQRDKAAAAESGDEDAFREASIKLEYLAAREPILESVHFRDLGMPNVEYGRICREALAEWVAIIDADERSKVNGVDAALTEAVAAITKAVDIAKQEAMKVHGERELKAITDFCAKHHVPVPRHYGLNATSIVAARLRAAIVNTTMTEYQRSVLLRITQCP